MADASIPHIPEGMKRCTVCAEIKPLDQFNKSRGRPRSECKICHRAAASAWQKNNRQRYRKRQNEWASRNRERCREARRRSYKKMTAEQKAKKYAAAEKRRIKNLYGLTWEDYNRLLEQQGGVCNICRIPGRTGRWDKLVVDHCHTTGAVRGLLCSGCNVAIAALGDSVEGVERALQHVRGELINV